MRQWHTEPIMMGYNHALSGAATWVAIAASAPALPTLGLVDVEPWQFVAGTARACIPCLPHSAAGN